MAAGSVYSAYSPPRQSNPASRYTAERYRSTTPAMLMRGREGREDPPSSWRDPHPLLKPERASCNPSIARGERALNRHPPVLAYAQGDDPLMHDGIESHQEHGAAVTGEHER